MLIIFLKSWVEYFFQIDIFPQFFIYTYKGEFIVRKSIASLTNPYDNSIINLWLFISNIRWRLKCLQ